MKHGMQVGLGPGYIVLDEDPAPLPKGAQLIPNFRPMCCGHMAGWIQMPLGMEVGLGPGDFVLDADPAPPPQKGCRAPSPIVGPLGPISIVAKWLDGSR